MVEALGLLDAEAVEQREDHQRGETLRRRRGVVERAGIDRDRQRLGERRRVAFEVGARDRRADAVEIAGDLARDVAAIEIGEPGMGELFERRGERRLPQHMAGGRRLAVDQEGLRETGNSFQLARDRRREIGEAARHRRALAGLADGVAEQHRERQRAALCLRGFERQHPAAYCAWYGQGRQRTARRDRFVFAIKLRPRVLAGAARRHQRADAPRRLAQEPEAVAADAVHVRIDDRDRRRHRDHRLDRVAALGEHRASGFRGRAVRRADDAAAMSGGVEVHQSTPAQSRAA